MDYNVNAGVDRVGDCGWGWSSASASANAGEAVCICWSGGGKVVDIHLSGEDRAVSVIWNTGYCCGLGKIGICCCAQ